MRTCLVVCPATLLPDGVIYECGQPWQAVCLKSPARLPTRRRTCRGSILRSAVCTLPCLRICAPASLRSPCMACGARSHVCKWSNQYVTLGLCVAAGAARVCAGVSTVVSAWNSLWVWQTKQEVLQGIGGVNVGTCLRTPKLNPRTQLTTACMRQRGPFPSTPRM